MCVIYIEGSNFGVKKYNSAEVELFCQILQTMMQLLPSLFRWVDTSSPKFLNI